MIQNATSGYTFDAFNPPEIFFDPFLDAPNSVHIAVSTFVLVVILFNLYMFNTLRNIQNACAFKKHIHKAFFITFVIAAGLLAAVYSAAFLVLRNDGYIWLDWANMAAVVFMDTRYLLSGYYMLQKRAKEIKDDVEHKHED